MSADKHLKLQKFKKSRKVTTLKDEQGATLKEHLETCGYLSAGNDNTDFRMDFSSVRCALELHIEQGPVMDAEGLRHKFMRIPGRVRVNLKLVIKGEKGITELNQTGSTMREEDLQAFFRMAEEETRDSEMVVLTGSLPPGCPQGTYRELMKRLEGKKLIVDTEGKELEMAAKAHPFLIKPNLHEMETTLGLELRTMRSIRDAALLFIRLGVEHAVVSMGAMGAMYVDAERTLFAPALRVAARSHIGAGDAMLGGMLLGYEKEGDMAKAFRYGVAGGAASVMTEGTQLIVPEDFYNLLEQVRIQEV